MSKAYVVKIDPKNPDQNLIASAAKSLKKGSLVIFPTETVYGIAANLFDDKAIAALYKIKERPVGKPFTVHISDIKTIEDMGCNISDASLKFLSL